MSVTGQIVNRKRILLQILAFVFTALFGAIVAVWISETWGGVKNHLARPYIAVVVSKESVDFPIPAEFLKGFEAAMPGGAPFLENQSGGRVDIKTFEDLGAVEEAERIANKLVTDENCILVIPRSGAFPPRRERS